MKCPHGFEVNDEPQQDVNTYCASCVKDALYDGSLGLDIGLHPDIKRKIRNKEKSERKKAK